MKTFTTKKFLFISILLISSFISIESTAVFASWNNIVANKGIIRTNSEQTLLESEKINNTRTTLKPTDDANPPIVTIGSIDSPRNNAPKEISGTVSVALQTDLKISDGSSGYVDGTLHVKTPGTIVLKWELSGTYKKQSNIQIYQVEEFSNQLQLIHSTNKNTGEIKVPFDTNTTYILHTPSGIDFCNIVLDKHKAELSGAGPTNIFWQNQLNLYDPYNIQLKWKIYVKSNEDSSISAEPGKVKIYKKADNELEWHLIHETNAADGIIKDNVSYDTWYRLSSPIGTQFLRVEVEYDSNDANLQIQKDGLFVDGPIYLSESRFSSLKWQLDNRTNAKVQIYEREEDKSDWKLIHETDIASGQIPITISKSTEYKLITNYGYDYTAATVSIADLKLLIDKNYTDTSQTFLDISPLDFKWKIDVKRPEWGKVRIIKKSRYNETPELILSTQSADGKFKDNLNDNTQYFIYTPDGMDMISARLNYNEAELTANTFPGNYIHDRLEIPIPMNINFKWKIYVKSSEEESDQGKVKIYKKLLNDTDWIEILSSNNPDGTFKDFVADDTVYRLSSPDGTDYLVVTIAE